MKKTVLSACIFILLCNVQVNAQTMTAEEIVDKADKHFRGETSISELSMTIIKPDWQREIRMKLWAKGRDYSLILLTEPARDKGTTFLMRDREVWNWIPSIERIIKIPPSMMMQSWMGSDFTNDDLVKESSIVKDYTHTLLGNEIIADRDCYKIKLVPKEDAAVVWGKVLLWISVNDYLQLKIEYYDEDEELVNIMTLSEIKKMDDRLIPTLMTMRPADKPDQKTVMKYHSIKFNEPLKESFFSEQNMKRVR